MASRARTAIGFSVHTGWAAAVAVSVGGSAEKPEVLARARLELLREEDGVVRFVFHSVEDKPLAEAREVVERARKATRRNALAEVKRFAEGLGAPVVAAGLAHPAGKIPVDLEMIVKSHALIHSAEGALFRDAVAQACEALGLRVERVPRKALFTQASMKKAIDGMGKALGPPWGADQKEAAALAWLALAARV
ncbi:MAG TPA: hypothetical protein VFA20_33995 [Myxococcaceae bacterium]|nr:hypothetical protein [Myxococcaceae bacterium]